MSSGETAQTGEPAPSAEPSFSAGSIEVRAKKSKGGQLMLQVDAPADTRFRLGRSEATAVECAARADAQGSPLTYRVVCPPAERGNDLIATISYGDFEYTFVKSLA